MLLYYITDRTQFPGDESARQSRLLAKVAEAARCGVDYIQLREKDLSTRSLEALARAAVHNLRTANRELRTVLLLNSRTDIALSTGAGGVHLPSNDISPTAVRKIWTTCGAGTPARVTVGVSCHSREEVARAAAQGADFVVFAPVFGKNTHSNPAGLEALRQVCKESIPVLALGGVTLDNANACLQAGAAGIAGIRLFQNHAIASVVSKLRVLGPHSGLS